MFSLKYHKHNLINEELFSTHEPLGPILLKIDKGFKMSNNSMNVTRQEIINNN